MSTHTQLTRADGARAELASTGQNAPAGKPASGPRAVAEPAVVYVPRAPSSKSKVQMPAAVRVALMRNGLLELLFTTPSGLCTAREAGVPVSLRKSSTRSAVPPIRTK